MDGWGQPEVTNSIPTSLYSWSRSTSPPSSAPPPLLLPLLLITVPPLPPPAAVPPAGEELKDDSTLQLLSGKEQGREDETEES